MFIDLGEPTLYIKETRLGLKAPVPITSPTCESEKKEGRCLACYRLLLQKRTAPG